MARKLSQKSIKKINRCVDLLQQASFELLSIPEEQLDTMRATFKEYASTTLTIKKTPMLTSTLVDVRRAIKATIK